METLFVALRVVVALAAVLGLIWVVQRKATKGSAKKGSLAGRFGAPKRAIQVLGSHRLTPKSSITVVEVEGVKMVLGVTEHGISVLDPAPTPAVTPVAVTIAHPDAIATPKSDPTQVAAPAEETLASAGVGEVDFSAVFREALDEAASAPVLSTVVEHPESREPEEEARPRRRRLSIPSLGEQFVPHMTRTLAAGLGLRGPEPVAPAASAAIPAPAAAPAPVPAPVVSRASAAAAFAAATAAAAPAVASAEPAPAAPARPATTRSALAAFLENAEPERPAKDYANATPLAESLRVLQRAS